MGVSTRAMPAVGLPPEKKFPSLDSSSSREETPEAFSSTDPSSELLAVS